jgi:hypothetical protein
MFLFFPLGASSLIFSFRFRFYNFFVCRPHSYVTIFRCNGNSCKSYSSLVLCNMSESMQDCGELTQVNVVTIQFCVNSANVKYAVILFIPLHSTL